MPYIDSDQRSDLDKIVSLTPPDLLSGELNYLITKILMKQYNEGMSGPSYISILKILGTLEAVKLEFYRRVAAPYEAAKCMDNGDVF